METELEMEVEIWLESILLTVDGANGLNERERFLLCVGVCLCVRIVNFKMVAQTIFYRRKWESSWMEREKGWN